MSDKYRVVRGACQTCVPIYGESASTRWLVFNPEGKQVSEYPDSLVGWRMAVTMANTLRASQGSLVGVAA